MISVKEGTTRIEGMRHIVKLEVLSVIASSIQGGAISKDELTEFIEEFEPGKADELLEKYIEKETEKHKVLGEIEKLLRAMDGRSESNDAKEKLRKAMENEWK